MARPVLDAITRSLADDACARVVRDGVRDVVDFGVCTRRAASRRRCGRGRPPADSLGSVPAGAASHLHVDARRSPGHRHSDCAVVSDGTGVDALSAGDRDPRAGGRLAARIAIRRGVPAVPPHRPSVHSVRGVDMKSLRPALALILVAPLVAEVLPGSAPLSRPGLLPFIVLIYGPGALLIRDVLRRSGRGWIGILLLGAACLCFSQIGIWLI